MNDLNPLVLTQGSLDLDTALARLVDAIAERDWLPVGGPRVELRLARGHWSPLVECTATALARAFADRLGPGQLAWVDRDPTADADPAWPGVMWESGESVPVAACGLGGAIRVPESWFEPARVVTVSGVGPDPHARLWGALEAQAEPLRTLNPNHGRAVLAYEAHRLGASDMVVVCGAGLRGAPDCAWWLAGPSDIAVDMVLARAAGVEPGALPRIRELGRHERLPMPVPVAPTDSLPPIRLSPGPAWTAAIASAWDRFHSARAFAADDVVAITRNLPKIPFFLRRYLRMFFPGRA